MGQIHAKDESFLANAELNRFAGAVTRFCQMVEGHDTYDLYPFVIEMDLQLPVLYATSQMLPDIDHEDDEMSRRRDELEKSNQLTGLHHEENVRDALVAKFGRWDRYPVVFDPFKDHATVESGFAEDISMVYGDLRRAMDIYLVGSEAAAQQAAWDWKFNRFHWGKHALGVIAATFALLTWHCDEDGGFEP